MTTEKIRWYGGGGKIKDYFKNYKEFRQNTLVHGINLKEGEEPDYIEPRIGEFTRDAYYGSLPEGGTFEEYGGKPLAYFKPTKKVSEVYHFATGDYHKKKGKPYIAVVERPDDARLAKGHRYEGDDLVLHYHGDKDISFDVPLGVEEGDIISEEGAKVIALVPYPYLRDNNVRNAKQLYLKLKKSGAWRRKKIKPRAGRMK